MWDENDALRLVEFGDDKIADIARLSFVALVSHEKHFAFAEAHNEPAPLLVITCAIHDGVCQLDGEAPASASPARRHRACAIDGAWEFPPRGMPETWRSLRSAASNYTDVEWCRLVLAFDLGAIRQFAAISASVDTMRFFLSRGIRCSGVKHLEGYPLMRS